MSSQPNVIKDRKIIVTFIHPPIPDRRFDRRAYWDGEEEGDYGEGRTAEEAVFDLLKASSGDILTETNDRFNLVVDERNGLLLERDRLAAEVARLERLVYVPGLWRCAKCEMTLISNTLHVHSGAMTGNNEPQKCANGCGPMWRVTERDAGNQAIDRHIADQDRFKAQLATLLAACKSARELAYTLGDRDTQESRDLFEIAVKCDAAIGLVEPEACYHLDSEAEKPPSAHPALPSLENIITYLAEEQKDYEQCSEAKRGHHIYSDVLALQAWLKLEGGVPKRASSALEALRMCEDMFRFIAEMHGKVENANAEQFRKASGDIVRRCNHALHHIANTVGDFRATNEIEDCQS